MPYIIGTAGHIDHGKTSLIKALTGEDTDRLKEEKERGISIDLGFAHRAGENAPLLEKGFILGTVNYLAPELCQTPPHDCPASDLFSLGVTLFEMLTGQLPYPAGSVQQTIRSHATHKPRDIRHLDHALPSGLSSLVMRLLGPEPDQRPRLSQVIQQLISLEIAALRPRKSA